jgi:pyrrolidone-carboxylate peptidase
VESNSYQEMEIKPFLQPTPLTKLAKGIGNSYCNFVSWKIMQLITKGDLCSQYTFLHIPRQMKPLIVIQELNHWLQDFRSS